MKKTLLAAAMLGLFSADASAQYYDRPPPGYRPPPPVYRAPPPPPAHGGPGDWRHARPYNWCQAKARRLHEFEMRSQLDGRVSRDEMRIAASLRADLQASCGGGRWHPQRGWFYG
jgi:hypothetical protein